MVFGNCMKSNTNTLGWRMLEIAIAITRRMRKDSHLLSCVQTPYFFDFADRGRYMHKKIYTLSHCTQARQETRDSMCTTLYLRYIQIIFKILKCYYLLYTNCVWSLDFLLYYNTFLRYHILPLLPTPNASVLLLSFFYLFFKTGLNFYLSTVH